MKGDNEWLHERDEVDGLIDEALGSYTPREPRAGLESRVLSHVAAAEAERGRRGWSWRAALAAAMALLALVWVPMGYRLMLQKTAVEHGPEIRQPAVGGVRHSAQADSSDARHTVAHHGRVATARHEGVEIRANTRSAAVERADVAPIDDKGAADEQATLKPITLTPITIAPIEIAALN